MDIQNIFRAKNIGTGKILAQEFNLHISNVNKIQE